MLALQNGNFAGAKSKFGEVLQLLSQIHPPDHPDVQSIAKYIKFVEGKEISNSKLKSFPRKTH